MVNRTECDSLERIVGTAKERTDSHGGWPKLWERYHGRCTKTAWKLASRSICVYVALVATETFWNAAMYPPFARFAFSFSPEIEIPCHCTRSISPNQISLEIPNYPFWSQVPFLFFFPRRLEFRPLNLARVIVAFPAEIISSRDGCFVSNESWQIDGNSSSTGNFVNQFVEPVNANRITFILHILRDGSSDDKRNSQHL